jgi:succinate-semialdehyde dehydrogenase/glutarate-semialdehyde dehydrogenase
MVLTSINPYNGEQLGHFNTLNRVEIEEKLQLALSSFREWRAVDFTKRAQLLNDVAENLKINRERLAHNISLEMGKPIVQARAEVDKCAWVCQYYADNAPSFLEKEVIETDGSESWVEYHPLGPILAIMPWNFPLWQVFRFAAPAVMAGNTCLLKHSSSVNLCARNIETLFNDSNAPDGLFQTLFLDNDQVEHVIAHPAVKAVTLTGSEGAGSHVAAIAGKHIKKTVLELGGSNAFVVLDDADIAEAVATGVESRFQNTGQSCIAAKRFLIQEKVQNEFIKAFVEKVKQLKPNDPLLEETEIGPMAREDLAEELERQVKQSVASGAQILVGGGRDQAVYQPTVLTGVEPGMPAFDEELFGPVAAVTVFQEDHQAIDLINKSPYGLGATICTKSRDRALQYIKQVEDGAVFINAGVKSDPRLPFGGTKKSGYGRELSYHGIKEFMNAKTIFFR